MTYLKHIASLLLALLVFSIASVNATESITYIHTDHLGSPIAATNEDGSVKWTEDYQPFGVQRTNQDSDNTTGFTGHQHDDALDLTYMQARWYHPEVGRFMALDPIVFRASDISSFGRYTYASNNPYKYIDPDGKESSLAIRLDNRVDRLASGEITREQYSAENKAEAVGGLVGLTVVVTRGTIFPVIKKALSPKSLTKQQKKSIRSLNKQIKKHEVKLKEFKRNPTVRKGMENQPASVIKKQQNIRINHLKTEIKTFKNNIKKVKKGEL